MSAIETRSTALIPGASGAAQLNNKADLARIETALRTDASITLLVNNAGTAQRPRSSTPNVEKMDEMIRLNVGALTRLTYAAAPGFVARGCGIIVNIASSAAISPKRSMGGGSKAKPSTLFGQFGDEQITAVGRELDAELERALRRAAE
jgi:NADP-dependent 3-hydroxy acid dehydrogenase YdfG